MKSRFRNVTLNTESSDGHNFTLLEWLYYRDSNGREYRTKTKTDGGSTPWCLWWFIPPFGKKYWFSFILHDGCFRDSIEIFLGGRWLKWTPTEAESNWLIGDALKSQKAWSVKRRLICFFLGKFGWRAFDEDRKKHPARRSPPG